MAGGGSPDVCIALGAPKCEQPADSVRCNPCPGGRRTRASILMWVATHAGGAPCRISPIAVGSGLRQIFSLCTLVQAAGVNLYGRHRAAVAAPVPPGSEAKSSTGGSTKAALRGAQVWLRHAGTTQVNSCATCGRPARGRDRDALDIQRLQLLPFTLLPKMHSSCISGCMFVFCISVLPSSISPPIGITVSSYAS